MESRAAALALLLAVALQATAALPPSLSRAASMVQGPATLKKPDAPSAGEERDTVVVEVVNTQRRAVILVQSSPTELGVEHRAAIRSSWMQPLNRSSEFALGAQDRHSYVVWFVVERDLDHPAFMVPVEEEGKLHGDVLIVNPSDTKPGPVETLGAIMRWVRVAYYQRFDFLVLVKDTSFVSLYNLGAYLDSNKGKSLFYSGGVNSFEMANANEYHHKYFAPFAAEGTIVVSADVVELVSRELSLLKKTAFDKELGYLLLTHGSKPVSTPQIVRNMKSVYAAIDNPVIIAEVNNEQMSALSAPVLVDGKYATPALPAQVAEIRTRGMYIDPHPKGLEPLCDFVTGKCDKSSLVAASARE